MSTWQLEHLFAAAKVQLIGDRYASTGIYKTAIESAQVDELGIEGDVQADQKVHGGIEKALHQYAQSSYAVLQQAFPDLATQFTVGSMGENISVAAMHEDNVHIGDIWQMGSVIVQVSQPRTPCWKINDKFGHEGIARIIEQHSVQGWYYRVLQAGQMTVGDRITLLKRPNTVSVRDFLTTYAQHRSNLAELQNLAACEGLSPKWSEKILKRIDYLQRL